MFERLDPRQGQHWLTRIFVGTRIQREGVEDDNDETTDWEDQNLVTIEYNEEEDNEQ